jgi:tetratricopeptide (TPR) repeat protein
MSARPGPSDEELIELLAAWDEALATGRPADLPPAPLEWQARFGRGVECMKRLRAALGGSEAVNRPGGLPFTHLGRFEVRREIGAGSCGVVFLAYDPQLRREVALKVPHATALLSPLLRERFLREARAAAGLSHPNIVGVYEAGEAGPVCYLAAQYWPGPSLAAWLAARTEAVPIADAARLVATLAAAVQHAHLRGVLHRDLKPANILLEGARGEGRGTREEETGLSGPSPLVPRPSPLLPKITDFGLAKLLTGDDGTQTQTGAILGTPHYMAPEQAQGKRAEVGPAADVYALGAILYELLTGRPPFVGDTVLETLEQVRATEPLPPSGLRRNLPRDLETICLRCLEKDPGKRYPSAGALAEDLRRYTRGEPVRARPVGAGERAWKWARRRPALAALFGTVVLSAVVLLSWGLWYSVQLRAYSQRLNKSARDARAQRALALQTLNDLVYNVEQQLRGTPDSQEIRRKILLRAVDGLGQVLRDVDPTVPDDTTAAAYLRLGHVLLGLNDVRQARQQFEQALAIAEASRHADPESLTARLHWGEAHRGLGEADSWLGDLASAREHSRTYLAIAEELARAAPEDLRVRASLLEACLELADSYRDQGDRPAARRYFERAAEAGERLPPRRELALAYVGLGRVCRELGDLPASRRALERSLEVHQRLPQDASSEAYARMDRGFAQNRLGLTLLELGEPEAGRRHLEQGVALIRQLADANPRWGRPRTLLALALVDLGQARLDTADLPGARQVFDEALTVRLGLAEADPRNLLHQQDLIETYGLMGRLEGGTLNPAAARAWYAKGLELLGKLAAAGGLGDKLRLARIRDEMEKQAAGCAAVLRGGVRLGKDAMPAPTASMEEAVIRAHALACAGRPLDAAAVAAAVREARSQDPERCVDVARCYALALAALVFRQGTARASSGSPEERQQYASLALAALAQAEALGLRDADRLYREPAFVALRREAGFRELMARLRKAG